MGATACVSRFAYLLNVVAWGWITGCDGLLVRRKILRLYWLSPLWLLREDCLFKLRWLASHGLLICLMLSHALGAGLRWVARETQNLASLLAGAAVMMGGDGVVKCDGEVGVLLGVFLYL